jgi:hypothetical protein
MPLCLVGSCTDQSIADRLGVGLPIKCFHLNVWHTSLSLSTVPATARAGPQCALYAKEPHTWSTSVRFLAADAVALGWRCGRVSPLHSIICKPSMRQNSLAECGRRSSASPKLKCEFMSVLQRKHCHRCVCVCVCVCVHQLLRLLRLALGRLLLLLALVVSAENSVYVVVCRDPGSW